MYKEGWKKDGPYAHSYQKPKDIVVSLHNPKEPADTRFIPATSIRIPLGYSTTIFITAKASEIDENGKDLTENQRNCRLEDASESLDVFNIYSKVACLFECHMKVKVLSDQN